MATALPDYSSGTGATQASETEAQFKTALINTRDALAQQGDPLAKFGVVQNLSLALSVAGNALTIAVKDRAGADPVATSGKSSEALVPFRNATVATGDFNVRSISAAHSLVVSSGSTLGTIANQAFRLWIVEFDNAGTPVLGVINCLSHVAGGGSGRDVQSIYPLRAFGIASSTAEGGAGAADNAQTFYTASALTSKPFRVLGYATWETGLATPGTWSAGPTRIQLFGAGEPLPGDILQVQRTDTGAVATGTTTIPFDDTPPQNTEGDQYMSQAITPSSAANVLAVRAQVQATNSGVGPLGMIAALFQDAVASALKAVTNVVQTASQLNGLLTLSATILAATTSATTLKVRAGSNVAGTTTFNGTAGGRIFGNVINSYLEVLEVMG
jgi:hypothetical protein